MGLSMILKIPRMGGIIVYGYGCWRKKGADGTLNVPNPMSWFLDMIEGWK